MTHPLRTRNPLDLERHDIARARSNERCLDELRNIMLYRPEMIVDYDPAVHRPEMLGDAYRAARAER